MLLSEHESNREQGRAVEDRAKLQPRARARSAQWLFGVAISEFVVHDQRKRTKLIFCRGGKDSISHHYLYLTKAKLFRGSPCHRRGAEHLERLLQEMIDQ